MPVFLFSDGSSKLDLNGAMSVSCKPWGEFEYVSHLVGIFVALDHAAVGARFAVHVVNWRGSGGLRWVEYDAKFGESNKIQCDE